MLQKENKLKNIGCRFSTPQEGQNEIIAQCA